MENAGRRVLVTGGLGFIGKHLCRKLLELGRQVIALDDESSSTEDSCNFILEKAQSDGQFRFIHGSMLDAQTLSSIQVSKVDLIFHLAAKLGVANVVQNRLDTLQTNILGTQNILKLASKMRCPTFIASSSEVYGKSESIPFKEDADLVLGPTSVSRWCYAASKIIDEHEALAYYVERGLPTVVGRFFNVCGPGQPPESGMVIPRMVDAAQLSQPIIVLGNGQQKRCFCHVADCVEALCALMLHNTSNVYGQVFNIGNPSNEISMLQLAQKIKAMTRSTSCIKLVQYSDVFAEGSFEDLMRRVPTIQKIQSTVSWTPKRDLCEIIEDSLSQCAH